MQTQKEIHICIKTANTITAIAKPSESHGYLEAIITTVLPKIDELSPAQQIVWISKNNARMRAICKFLNENDL